MIIEMFSKLIAIQLLLLYAGTKSEDYPTKLVPKGGFFISNGTYQVDENQIIDLVLTTIGKVETNITWKVPQEFAPVVTCDRKKYKDGLDIITAAVKFVAHRSFDGVNLTYRNSIPEIDYDKHVFNISVQYAKAPEISIVVDGEVDPIGDRFYVYEENYPLSLRCIGAGIRNVTLTWVDCNGHPIISNQLTGPGPQVKL